MGNIAEMERWNYNAPVIKQCRIVWNQLCGHSGAMPVDAFRVERHGILRGSAPHQVACEPMQSISIQTVLHTRLKAAGVVIPQGRSRFRTRCLRRPHGRLRPL